MWLMEEQIRQARQVSPCIGQSETNEPTIKGMSLCIMDDVRERVNNHRILPNDHQMNNNRILPNDHQMNNHRILPNDHEMNNHRILPNDHQMNNHRMIAESYHNDH
ncbi:hypothetical protein CDAR_368251 [Caerostris darwini]|uniref:Uncharacterized protein n=1 Tax=Caerostris darwini TaxID=1538125 RepID=A0AAV4WEU3_9ARAC|nr:hypothetical protein CDAR_368251 [Caerostris darwini]